MPVPTIFLFGLLWRPNWAAKRLSRFLYVHLRYLLRLYRRGRIRALPFCSDTLANELAHALTPSSRRNLFEQTANVGVIFCIVGQDKFLYIAQRSLRLLGMQ